MGYTYPPGLPYPIFKVQIIHLERQARDCIPLVHGAMNNFGSYLETV